MVLEAKRKLREEMEADRAERKREAEELEKEKQTLREEARAARPNDDLSPTG